MIQLNKRVRWKHREPGATQSELNGKVVLIGHDGGILVKFDNGDEEWCDKDDLEITDDC